MNYREAEFEKAHAAFIARHLERRSGERRNRLERGHQHGEKLFLRNVWWPLVGHFDDLHPEYEIVDWRGRSYFADFAYLPGRLQFLWEVKGYGPHVRDMDRKRFCDECNRELFLQGIGYRVVSFAYDDVADRPDLCINLLRMLLSRYVPGQQPFARAFGFEHEIIRLALSGTEPIRPIDVALEFRLSHRTAVRRLQSLAAKGWLQPVARGKSARITSYELVRGAWDCHD